MQSRSYSTRFVPAREIKREWYVIDAEGKTLGRMASKIASILRGKHKPAFTPNSDCGDNVIVLNASKVRLTGKKLTEKEHVHYTGYPGGQRFRTPREILEKNPGELIELAVRGMLPKNSLGRRMFRRLHVYNGNEHPHFAQQPKPLQN
ncbi:MAG: 50S ribosomal protein L13 [Chitinophagales bacterium]|nr:50S ribosomal protein L13 [Chitinophagales bacterium]MDW8273973.1 50S ribosomal protein L13 [Chitinophagales bacterium]